MNPNGFGSFQGDLKSQEQPELLALDPSSDDKAYKLDALAHAPRVNGLSNAATNGALPIRTLLSDESGDEDELEEEEEEEDVDDEWDIDSLFEDTLEELGDENLYDGSQFVYCSLAKSCANNKARDRGRLYT